VEYTIQYYSESVEDDILKLPDTLAARYIVLTRRMIAIGPNLGEPHTKHSELDCSNCDSREQKESQGCSSVLLLAEESWCCTASSRSQPKRLCGKLKLPKRDWKRWNVRTHEQVVKALLRRPGVKAEVVRIEREEGELLDALLKARQDAGLTQAQVAQLMGTQAPSVARLERSLATGKHSPSVATLRKYAQACGKNLVLTVA
jgi:DNA-binding XRE family transcriptional regulator